MPSLGFLKKKRTREGDPSSASNPTSPVTPTTTRSFDTGALPSSHPAHPNSFQIPPRLPSQGEKQQMNSATLQQPAAFAPPVPTPSPASIANLLNQPPQQHDGAPQASIHSQQSQPQSVFPIPPANGAAAADLRSQPTTAMAQPQAQVTQAAQEQARQTKGKYSLADFEILRTLGTGSFGRVHLVQSRHNQRFYAVKVLKKAQVVKMKQVEHTNDERKMLGEVKHPFLITLWGTFQDPRNLYMVMDFVEGGELFSLLRKSGVCPKSCPLS